MRLLPTALLALLLVHALPARAAESQECPAPMLSLLGRELKVAHFTPSPARRGKDAAGVVLASACKRQPDDPRLTLAAVAWDAHQDDTKALAIAIVDESASTIVALRRDDVYEDATTCIREGSLRLDTAPCQLAPGVRAFGLDIAIALGAVGRTGWRDLVPTVIAHRSDHEPTRQPLRVAVPYDGSAYDLKAFNEASARWGR